jgi:hypothetical protein
MNRNLLILAGVVIVLLTSVFWLSCSGGGGSSGSGSSGGGASTGNVALYVTDDMSEDFEQVTVTVNSVSLEHTGSVETCDVLTTPVTLDLTDLSSMIQLLDVTACEAVNYNRIRIEFSEQVIVTEKISDTTATCKFTSYKDQGGSPNVLQCDAGICSININGAVNVFAGQNNKVALDFDLKEFEVEDFDTPTDCSVTMKVSPLHGDDFDDKHDEYEEGISGNVSNLDTETDSFTLTAESGTFTVSYSNVVTAGIDNILALAVTGNLKVTVKASTINLDTSPVEASAIYVKVEGTVSDLYAVKFTLIYPTDNTLPIDYSNAEEVEGVLTDGASAEVQINGYDGVNYLAREVEVGEPEEQISINQ